MTFDHPLYRAALWLACCAAGAAHAGPRGPAAADAVVPATRYQPLLPYHPAAPGRTSPDQNWQALNRTVAGYDAMSLAMGGMDGPATGAGAAADPAPAATGHGAARDLAPAAAGHASDEDPQPASAGHDAGHGDPVPVTAGHLRHAHGRAAPHRHGAGR